VVAGVAGEHNDRDRQAVVLLEPLQDHEPGHARHHHVEDHQVRRGLDRLGDADLAVRGADDAEPAGLEDVPQQVPDVRVVVDDQDRASAGHGANPCS
jgi:hypothetical protein